MNVQASIKAERVAGIVMRLEASGIKVGSIGHLVRLGLEALEDRFGPAYRLGAGEAVEYLQRYERGGLLGQSLRMEDRRSLGLEADRETRRELGAVQSTERPAQRPAFSLSPEAIAFARSMGFSGEAAAAAAEEPASAERSEASTGNGAESGAVYAEAAQTLGAAGDATEKKER